MLHRHSDSLVEPVCLGFCLAEKKERKKTAPSVWPLFSMTPGNIVLVNFGISFITHPSETALHVFDAVPWFLVNKAFRATKTRLKMQPPKGVTKMCASRFEYVKICWFLGSHDPEQNERNVEFALALMWYVTLFNQNKQSHARRTLTETLNLLQLEPTHTWNKQCGVQAFPGRFGCQWGKKRLLAQDKATWFIKFQQSLELE